MTKIHPLTKPLLIQMARQMGGFRQHKELVQEELKRLEKPSVRREFKGIAEIISMNPCNTPKLRLCAFAYLNALRQTPANRKKSK